MSKQSDLVTVARDAGASGYVNVAGDTMTGPLVMDTAYQNGLRVLRDYNVQNGPAAQAIQFGAKLGSTPVYPVEMLGVVDTDGTAFGFEVRQDTNLHLKIDSAGRVTTPYQPMFKVNGNTSQWLRMGSAGVWYTITNASGVNDAAGILGANLSTNANGSVVGSGFNASTGRFTAPVSGLYLFTLSLYVNKVTADGAYIHINSLINGGVQGDYSIFGPRPASSGYIDGLTMSWLNYLQANDTWAPAIYNSNVNSVDVYGDYVRIGGYLLG